MTDKLVPVALRLWLLFLLAFVLLGYAVVPSILFGAVGGFAGGLISAWWSTPGGEPTPAQQAPSALEKLGGRIGGRLQPRGLGSRLPFLKLFTRRDRRYSNSRR